MSHPSPLRTARRCFAAAMLLATAGAFLPAGAHAQATVHLKDGRAIQGTIVSDNAEGVTVRVKFGTITFPRDEVARIEKPKAGAATAAHAGAGAWRDELTLTSGETYRGLIVSEDTDKIVFDVVMSGSAVSRTMLMRVTYAKARVKTAKRLTDEQRAAARKHLERVRGEAARSKAAERKIRIEPSTWEGRGGARGISIRKVALEHFVIESNTEEDFVRRAAHRLAKVFAAYKQHFGADRKQPRKVRVLIFNSMPQYYAAIGGKMLNPAFYSPTRKLIGAGCDLAKYKIEIKQTRRLHADLNRQLEGYQKQIDDARAEVRALMKSEYDKTYAGGRASAQSRARFKALGRLKIQWELQVLKLEKQGKDIQGQIRVINRKNDRIFEKYTQHMFATLYHEGFHAFVDQFLFEPDAVRHVPRWLNEGLAQYFELARMEGGRLVLGREDRDRLRKLRAFYREKTLIPIDQMVRGGAKEYLVHSKKNQDRSTHHYFQAWCLIHLIGKQGRLNQKNLRAYVDALVAGRAPADALPLLTGMSNAKLNALWDEYLSSSIKVR